MESPFENMPDDELIERICQGCEEALLYLVVDRCGGIIKAVAKSFRYDSDLSQDICVRLFGAGDWKRLRNWKGQSLKSWIRRIATTICLNQYRSRMKFQERFRCLLDGDDPVAAQESGPGERLFSREEDWSRVLRAINTLSKREQAIIRLHALGEMTIQELADHLGVLLPAARVAKTRAIQRLRQSLTEDGGRDD